MSKDNRTIEMLLSNLDEETSWRKVELSYIYSSTKFGKDVKNYSGVQTSLLRSAIAILYAHWEGFVKSAATHYLNYVALQRVRNSELSYNFLALSYRGHLSTLETGQSDKRALAIEKLFSELDSRAQIPYRGIIDTKSNLRFWVFKEVCENIGLDYSKYQLKSKAIDNLLVDRRNAVAHGQYLTFGADDFETIYDIVIDLIDSFKEDILVSARSKRFLRQVQTTENLPEVSEH